MHQPLTVLSKLSKPQSITFSVAILKSWMLEVEKTFSLPKGTMTKKNPETGKPYRKAKTTDLCELRRAIVHVVYECGHINVVEMAKVFGIDHSSVCVMKRTAKGYAEKKDDKFLEYYHAVKSTPIFTIAA